MTLEAARESVLRTFRWIDGHADMWRLFSDVRVLDAVTDHLAAVCAETRSTKVAGIEARGFILGAAVALHAHVGFVPIRKAEGLLPGDKVTELAAPDYREQRHLLRVQKRAVEDRDRVLLVDDWAERGNQAAAARALLERAGAHWAGIAVVVDQLPASRRDELAPVHHIVTAEELGPSDGGGSSRLSP